MTRRNEKLPRLWADAGRSASWWGVGPPVSGSPHLPLLCCGGSDRWSPKVLAPVPAMLLQPVQRAPSPAWRQRARETWGRCPAPSPPPPQGSIAYREGSPLRLFSLQTLCYLPVDVCNSYSFALKTWWNGGNSLSRQNMPTQGLSAMPNLKSRLETSCKRLIFQWDWDWARGAKLDVLYVLMWSRIIPEECFACSVMHVDCVIVW